MKPVTRFVLAALLAAGTQAAVAADLRVRVFERGGDDPLGGVAVCLGTEARADQFGAKLTDASGHVEFDSLPTTRLVVTASMPGYKSEQEVMEASVANRMVVLSMSRGGGGPQCKADRSGMPVAAGVEVNKFAINNGAAVTTSNSVTLNNAVTGEVTQYRASERSDFSDTEWRDYTAAPVLKLSEGKGKKHVWFQVRRHTSVNGASVETTSPAVSDSILLQGN